MPTHMPISALRYLLLALIILWSFPSRAHGVTAGGPDRAPCDALHPAHFTRIEERQPTYFELASEGSAVVLFEPELPVPDSSVSLTTWCMELEGRDPPADTIGIHPGRFNVSERSELVLTFDPGVVHGYVGHLGRLDIEGQIVTGNNTARPIEIPGYREIGKPVMSAADQGHRHETVIASIAQVLQAAEELVDSNNIERTKLRNAVGKATDAGVERVLTDELFGERWLMTQLFHSPQQYEAVFENILAHSSPIALASAGKDGQGPIQRVLTVARLGQRVLEQRASSLERIRERLVRKEIDLDREIINWYARGLEARALAPTTPAPIWAQDTNPARVCSQAFVPQYNPFCSESFLLETCSELVQLTEALCRPPIAAGNQKGLVDRVQKLIRETSEKLDARVAVRAQALRNASSAELYELMVAHVERFALSSPEKNTQGLALSVWLNRLLEELSGLKTVVYEQALLKELDALHTALKDEKARQKAMGDLRNHLQRHAASGWREVRLQPKVIGAKAGDVIELKISYVPSGGGPSTAASVTTPAATGEGVATGTAAAAAPASSPPSDGTQRTAVWTLRFLVDRSGVYVTAGPRLSLVSTLDYKPDATSFQGARGKLVLGVGVDLMYMPGKGASFTQRLLGFMVPGGGLRLDNLDFDTSQSVELGLEAHVLLLRGVFSLGVGYAVTSPRPPVNRGVYFSLGLGVEQAFDMARDLANEFSR